MPVRPGTQEPLEASQARITLRARPWTAKGLGSAPSASASVCHSPAVGPSVAVCTIATIPFRIAQGRVGHTSMTWPAPVRAWCLVFPSCPVRPFRGTLSSAPLPPDGMAGPPRWGQPLSEPPCACGDLSIVCRRSFGDAARATSPATSPFGRSNVRAGNLQASNKLRSRVQKRGSDDGSERFFRFRKPVLGP